MQKQEEIKKKYAKLKDYIDEAGPFFRQKAHYSADEKIAFIVNFYTNFMSLIRLLEESENENNDKHISIGVCKTSITKKLVEQEFESAVCVVYFNLSKDEILALEDRAKKIGGLKEALILKKLFEKYLI